MPALEQTNSITPAHAVRVALSIRDYEEALSGRCADHNRGETGSAHEECREDAAEDIGLILITPVLDSLTAAGIIDRVDIAHFLDLAIDAIEQKMDSFEEGVPHCKSCINGADDPILSKDEISRLLDDTEATA
jgi:hypothetical protein